MSVTEPLQRAVSRWSGSVPKVSSELAVLDDSGRAMDAHYTVHPAGAGAQLFFKAGGGPDNRQFLDGLEQLLRGLGRRRIFLGRVAIDTSQTRGKWSLEERTLAFSYPVDLAAERDYRDLRMRITGSARRHLTVPSSHTSRLLLELFATDPNLDVAAEAMSLGTDSDFGPTADESVLRERADRYRRRAADLEIPAGIDRPQATTAQSQQFVRDPRVRGWVERQADGNCELCGERTFTRPDGSWYIEVHHVVPLAEGGSDTVDNAVALCPSCHRACHHASDSLHRTEALYARIRRLRRGGGGELGKGDTS